jgi:DNA damage-inducible protein 1
MPSMDDASLIEHTLEQGRDVDLLFGLDMLKAHQACIDLQKNCLRIRDREIRFLSEHELPDKAKVFEMPPDDPNATPSGSRSVPRPTGSTFPGSGNSLGATPAAAPNRAGASSARPPQAAGTSKYPEASIQTLIGLGATREQAIQTLDVANGNLDVAASLLF